MSFDHAEDEAPLVHLASLGDASAMETLRARHQPMLRLLARRLAGTGATQEELVQAGCLGLIQAVQRYDARQSVRLLTYAVPWILGEMKRALRNADRRGISLDAEPGDNGVPLRETLPGSSGMDMDRIDLRLAMQRLPEEEQTLICLRYFRDRTQKETAELLRRSQTQVSRMERRALDRLHAWLT